MDFKLYHFHGSDKIFKNRAMISDVAMTVEHVFNVLKGNLFPDNLLRIALDEMGWHKGSTWNIVAGHHYQFEGFKNGVGLEECLGACGCIVEGLVNLQVAYDKGQIDGGLLLLSVSGIPECNGDDAETILIRDVNSLGPTISLPVSVCLYDFTECESEHEPSKVHIHRTWREKDLRRNLKHGK